MEYFSFLFYMGFTLLIFCFFAIPILVINSVINKREKLEKFGEKFINLINPIILIIFLIEIYIQLFERVNFVTPISDYFYFNIDLIIAIVFVNYYISLRSEKKKVVIYDYINLGLMFSTIIQEILGLINSMPFVDFADKSINYEIIFGMNILMLFYGLILFVNFIRFFLQKEPLILKKNINIFFIMWGVWSSFVVLIVPLFLLFK